ncbi:D-amino acid dehydrogenase small subunit [Rhodovulum sp. P5]|uniref:NAD(P)/FAD-dependent oxidoreductase n=1 Tax=Rhodovulum sp. P5 TaxID=1564506 RepID=UPI0009C296FB|nr:FAD-dependent oxidoreductase [Rhodovulum sp. P5]ARE38339.1 D-amino acid dehydrogenase small subunit [Rhodovulum sp. P5]
MSDPAKTVAVIGAGIVGVATAIWLQRAGHRVVLIDRKGPAGGASFGNAGLLASSSVVPVPVPGLAAKAPGMLFDPMKPLFLKWGYLPRLAPWLARYLSHANGPAVRRRAAALHTLIGDSLADHQALAAGTRAERWIVPSDYVFLYGKRQDYECDAFGWGIRRELGIDWEVLEGDAVRAYDPAIGKGIGCAVRLGGHGRIADPGRYVADLAAHAEAQGARLIIGEVSDIVRNGGHVTGIRVGGETVPCDAAVIATGAWSGPLARRLGVNVPLETERGYHLDLWEPSVMPRSVVMIAAGKFLATPMAGRLRLAGVVEFGGLEAPPSRAPFRLLERLVQDALPGLTWQRREEWMGHRPAMADSLPAIGPVPGLTGAFLGFGHDHVGLTAGAKTGRILAQLVSGTPPNIDLAPFGPTRFQ